MSMCQKKTMTMQNSRNYERMLSRQSVRLSLRGLPMAGRYVKHLFWVKFGVIFSLEAGRGKTFQGEILLQNSNSIFGKNGITNQMDLYFAHPILLVFFCLLIYYTLVLIIIVSSTVFMCSRGILFFFVCDKINFLRFRYIK